MYCLIFPWRHARLSYEAQADSAEGRRAPTRAKHQTTTEIAVGQWGYGTYERQDSGELASQYSEEEGKGKRRRQDQHYIQEGGRKVFDAELLPI